MNQSIGANSFEKSFEKRTDGWQQESANELWKASFSSTHTQNVQNSRNQVYENLLRICEEIDADLPEIHSTVNKIGELHINEQKYSSEEKPLEDVFARNVAFEDIGTSLEDIEIYEDILNASAMMDNDDCIYNQNFDIMKTNQIYHSDTFSDLLSLPIPDSMQTTHCKPIFPYGSLQTSIFDQTPIFTENDIEHYLSSKNFTMNNDHLNANAVGKPTHEDSVDPLQFWHKLNCKIPDPRPSTAKVPTTEKDDDEGKKSTKSVLAIFDFTMPSLSSSASSCALSSPEQKTIENEPIPLESSDNPALPNIDHPTEQSSALGLPELITTPDVNPSDAKKPNKKKTKKNKKKVDKSKKTLELLKQDLILSTSSSSESSSFTVSDTKPLKKRKLNTEPIANPKSPSTSKKSIVTKSTKKPHTRKSSDSNPKSTSPTLSASALYIEQQLNTARSQAQEKPPKPEETRLSSWMNECQKYIPQMTKLHKYFSKEDAERKSKRSRKDDSKKYNTRSNSKSKPDSAKKKNKNSSPASMPSLTPNSPTKCSLKHDINNNLNSVQCPTSTKTSKKKKSKNLPHTCVK